MMSRNWLKNISLSLLILCLAALPARAQESVTPPTSTTQEELDKQKEIAEQKGFALLEQLLAEVQMLRLPENRIRVQISAADLLWDRNQGRARSLFSLAADSVAEMLRNNLSRDPGSGRNSGRSVNQLRRDLIFAAARHDAPMAYQLLATTRPLTPASGGSRSADADENLEEDLLAQVAALDPKVALQNAEQLLAKGELPRSLAQLLRQLQLNDPEAAAKLEEKVLRSLKSANLAANRDASSLALSLLESGPRSQSGPATTVDERTALLGQSAYQDLMLALIEAALRATPQAATSNQRASSNNRRGAGSRQVNSLPTDVQTEQNNARRLLERLQPLLPWIDQTVPSRSQAVRQKLAELGLVDNQRNALRQVLTGAQQANVDSLLAVASGLPPRLQARVYEQAALKAIDEGNTERAGQIATDHLETAARNRVLQQIEFRKISAKVNSETLESLPQTLANLRSDDERFNLLLRLSSETQTKDPQAAVKLLDQARPYAARRATSYQQFEQQLKLAEAFRPLDTGRSFETLEPGISQLNELLSAAATLSGFEVNVFRDGELPLQGGSNLNRMITRYGRVIGSLATVDSERAETLANRFQFSEPRIMVRLAIVRRLLGLEAEPVSAGGNRVRGFGQGSFLP